VYIYIDSFVNKINVQLNVSSHYFYPAFRNASFSSDYFEEDRKFCVLSKSEMWYFR